MKRFFTLVATLALIVSCKEEPKDYIVISGKITNKPVGEFTINSNDGEFTKSVLVLDDGTFIDTLDVNKGNYILYDGRNRTNIYLDKGYDLKISYNNDDFENSLSISGEGSDIANYLIKKDSSIRNIWGSAEEFYTLPEGQFKDKLNQIRLSSETLLDSFENIPNDYKIKENHNVNYFCLAVLSDYEIAYREFANNPTFTTSEGFLDELDSIDYNNEEDFLFSSYYKGLVNQHYRNKATKLTETDSISNEDAYFKILKNIDNQNIREGLLYRFASSSMVYSKDVESFYKNFMSISTDSEHKTKITDAYNKLTAIAQGKPSPKFINYENYKGGATSLDDLKGKYVYIDVWATWCAPCIAQIPSLKKVENDFQDKNIQFVSISIDKINDKEKWKQMIDDKDLSGLQLFADNDWNSGFLNEYSIESIPRFILIDPDGIIVDPNAPRPSDPELVELFDELNI